jgi:D-threonate/D-erythronate kinase
VRPTLSCLIIADDLTGACDAAAGFAARGFRTLVEPVGAACEPECDVFSINAESRTLEQSELEQVFAGIRARDLTARVVFKKIDSTLRGNAGREIALAAEAFGCDAAVIAPAFPAMGRIVEAGVLRVRGADCPVDLKDYWRAQKLEGCVHTSCAGAAAAFDAGARYVSMDAVCDDDLDAIVEFGAGLKRRILWAGSAGLARAIARHLRPGVAPAPVPPGSSSAALFCIGSTHSVTGEQVEGLLASRDAILVESDAGQPKPVHKILAAGRHVILRIARNAAPSRIAGLLAGSRAPLVLSGGDTASLVCSAIGARYIELRGELAAGIPAGVLRGGSMDAVPAVTKAGGFGNPDTLVNIADYFTCQTP